MKAFNRITNIIFIIISVVLLAIIIYAIVLKGFNMLALVAIILDIALGAYSIFDLKKGGE
jgi:hypothetical protein